MKKNMTRILLLAAATALPASAWAINKCTGPDGRVVYQEAACSSDSKTAEVKVAPTAAQMAARWQFGQFKDEMTGSSVCFLASPTIYTGMRNIQSGFAHVTVQLAVGGPGVTALSIRTRTSGSDLFHHDLSGTGIKVDGNDFEPLTRRFNAHAVGFSGPQEAAVTRQLEAGRQFRLRLRFWPYQQLHDTDPISLAGFKEAMTKALNCAKQ